MKKRKFTYKEEIIIGTYKTIMLIDDGLSKVDRGFPAWIFQI